LTPVEVPAEATLVIPTIPDSSPAATPTSCWTVPGTFEMGQVDTDLLPLPLEYRVYLPPCYSEHPERAYPVLYLIHGQSSTDDQWQRLGAGSTADALIQAGEIAPLLIVMPRDRVWREPTEDYFGQALVDALVPWIDSHYRTLPAREYRAVGGLSRGGAWALHLGLTHAEMFGSVGIHSGFVFHSDVPFIRIWLADIPASQMPRFFMDLGENDRPEITDSAIWFEGLLTELNIPHEWHLFPGYHEEAYWQGHLVQYLSWYAQGWSVEP
jgi:enterochelin esterase-like enzyme